MLWHINGRFYMLYTFATRFQTIHFIRSMNPQAIHPLKLATAISVLLSQQRKHKKMKTKRNKFIIQTAGPHYFSFSGQSEPISNFSLKFEIKDPLRKMKCPILSIVADFCKRWKAVSLPYTSSSTLRKLFLFCLCVSNLCFVFFHVAFILFNIRILICLHTRRLHWQKTLLSSSMPFLPPFCSSQVEMAETLGISSVCSLQNALSTQTIANEIVAYQRWADVRISTVCCARFEFRLDSYRCRKT